MLRNQEFKSIIKKASILGLVFLIIGLFLLNIGLDRINKKIISRDSAIVGNLIEEYPESKESIISGITKNAKEEGIEKGREILDQYGYNKNISKSVQPLLSNTSNLMVIYFIIYLLIFVVILLSVIYFEYRKIYNKVNRLSEASERVMKGEFSMFLEEDDEGDFSILNHHFNQMSDRLKNSLDSLQNEKIYLKDTISDISHQLKTPLSSLIILNDILLDDKELDEELKLEFLERTHSQLDRMEWLILNLLKLARIEAGSIDFKEEIVSSKEVVDIAINTLTPLIEGERVKIEGNLNSQFTGDKDWTVEALINLIKNAIEHGRGKVWISLEESPLFTSIIVKDNGEGISDKDLSNIFQRFYKGRDSVKPNSIGIGLNLSKSIIEAQGGTISVDSKRDAGTRFTIRFLKKNLG